MKTRAQCASTRFLSLLLTLMMLLSVIIVGSVPASAAETEIVETSWTGNETFRFLSNLTAWDGTAPAFTRDGVNDCWTFNLTGVSTSSDIYFRIYDQNNNQSLRAAVNDDLLEPDYDSEFFCDVAGFDTNTTTGNSWKIAMSRFAANGTTVDVHFTFYPTYTYNGTLHENVIKIVVDGGNGSQQTTTAAPTSTTADTSGTSAGTGSITIHYKAVPQNTNLATTPYLYVWNAANDTPIGTAWPGVQGQVADAYGYYSRSVDFEGNYKFIVNNNAGSQTVDSEATSTNEIWVVVDNAVSNGKYTMTVYDSNPDFTISVPTLSSDVSTCALGDTITLTAACATEGNLHYTFYKDTEVISTVNSSTGSAEYEYTAVSEGTSNYTVVVSADNTAQTATSTAISIEVTGYVMSVTLSAEQSTVEAGSSIILTAHSDSLNAVTYTLYDSDDNQIDQNTSGTFFIATTSADNGTTKTYYVIVSTDMGGEPFTVTSNDVTVSITTVIDFYTVTVCFKSADSYGYVPLLSTTGAVTNLDNAAMTRGAFLGKNASQTASFFWYTTTVTVPESSASLTLLVRSSRYALQASCTISVTASGTLYFGCDNLNSGTTLVNLTDCPQAEREWVESSVHMIYDANYDGTLAPSGAGVNLADIGDVNGDGEVNIRDASLIQKSVACITALTLVQKQLADADSDGVITIKDATAVQRRVACL